VLFLRYGKSFFTKFDTHTPEGLIVPPFFGQQQIPIYGPILLALYVTSSVQGPFTSFGGGLFGGRGMFSPFFSGFVFSGQGVVVVFPHSLVSLHFLWSALTKFFPLVFLGYLFEWEFQS